MNWEKPNSLCALAVSGDQEKITATVLSRPTERSRVRNFAALAFLFRVTVLTSNGIDDEVETTNEAAMKGENKKCVPLRRSAARRSPRGAPTRSTFSSSTLISLEPPLSLWQPPPYFSRRNLRGLDSRGSFRFQLLRRDRVRGETSVSKGKTSDDENAKEVARSLDSGNTCPPGNALVDLEALLAEHALVHGLCAVRSCKDSAGSHWCRCTAGGRTRCGCDVSSMTQETELNGRCLSRK